MPPAPKPETRSTDPLLLALDAHLRSKGSSWKTTDDYLRVAERFLTFLKEGGIDPQAASGADAGRFLASVSHRWQERHPDRKEVPSATLAIYSFALRALFESMGFDPNEGTHKIQRVKVRRRDPKVPKEEHIAALLAAAYFDPLENALLTTLAYSGIRAAELRSLTVENLHPERGSISIVAGKGQKDRQVFVTPNVFAAIRRYLAERPTTGPGVPIFRLTKRSMERIIERLIRRTNKSRPADDPIPFWVTPHKFRHAYATSLLEQGENLRVIQRQLGHSSVATTEIYTHVIDRDVRERIERRVPNFYRPGEANPKTDGATLTPPALEPENPPGLATEKGEDLAAALRRRLGAT